MNKVIILILVALVILTGAILLVVLQESEGNFGSIGTGQAYTATTTPSGLGEWTDQTLALGWGQLGSVIITSSGDIRFTLYDATSTAALTTDPRLVKSLQQLARIPANLAVGTYVFDVTYINGLVLDVEAGTIGTSTITFKR